MFPVRQLAAFRLLPSAARSRQAWEQYEVLEARSLSARPAGVHVPHALHRTSLSLAVCVEDAAGFLVTR